MGERNHKPGQKKLKIFLLILAISALVEVLALIWLFLSVGSYKNFWIQKAKDPGEITYLALGDSAAQGIGATSPMRGYVGLIAKSLQAKTGKTVRVVNLSVSGAKIKDVIRDQIPQISGIKADVVTIEIGGNDVAVFNAQTYRQDFSLLLTQLPKGTFVSDMPLFNSRPKSTQPAKQASKIIAELVQDNPDFRFVALQKQTSEHQSIFGFAPDLFHPNNLSYKNWYQAFWDQIESTL